MRSANSPFLHADDTRYRYMCNAPGPFWQRIESRLKVDYSDDLKDLIRAMVGKDPSERPSVDQLLACEWLKGPTATCEQLVEMLTAAH